MDVNKLLTNLEIIEWAFEKGYKLARDDEKQSVYISFEVTKEYFLQQLEESLELQSDDFKLNENTDT